MRYTISMLEDQVDELRARLFIDDNEGVAYAFARVSRTDTEVRLLITSLSFPEPHHVLETSPRQVRVSGRSFVPSIVAAANTEHTFVFIHSHPGGLAHFSPQDDQEEARLFRTANIRAGVYTPHASLLVVGGPLARLVGRVWLPGGEVVSVERIRVIGRRVDLFDSVMESEQPPPPIADRQVLAFGPRAQHVLQRLHVGVVGHGGTGSSVTEQLIRLGVGRVMVIDPKKLSASNPSRVYGSGVSDEGTPKVELASRQARAIGTGTQVEAIQGDIADLHVATRLRECDIIFGCTDDYLGRMILNRIACAYYIPVIDVAVKIDSEEQTIRNIVGRVTILRPGTACLRCRQRIPQAKLNAQQQLRHDPEEYRRRVQEGYAAELADPDPAVIMFTTSIAARGMMEFLNFITGFMADKDGPHELIEFYDQRRVRGNSAPSREPACFCSDRRQWGRGDRPNFLDLTW